MGGREKGGRRVREGEETEEVASRGRWQGWWACGIEKCPVGGREGRTSEYLVLRGVSRSRASEDRQHPWWESGGKIRNTVSPSQPKTLAAQDWKTIISKFTFLITVKEIQ